MIPNTNKDHIRSSRITLNSKADTDVDIHSSTEATTTTTEAEPLNHIDGVQNIADSYSTFLLDMWGVMHDGSKPYDGVLKTVEKLRAKADDADADADADADENDNKKLIILSNSSKRLPNAIKMLTKLGFNPNQDFHQIITSGDVSHRMLSGDTTLQCSTWSVLQDLIANSPKNVFVFGSGDGDEEYCESSGWTLSSIEQADLIVARGTFTINDGSGDVVTKQPEIQDGEVEYFRVLEDKLAIAAERRIPMLVTNPDKVRPDKGLPPMPGAIGDAYEKHLVTVMGGNGDEGDATKLVKRIGKPFKEVYELALQGLDPSSAVMVGDALETDITGGTWSEVDTLWVVNDGIHSPFVNEMGSGDYKEGVKNVLEDFNQKKGCDLSPTSITKHFRW